MDPRQHDFRAIGVTADGGGGRAGGN